MAESDRQRLLALALALPQAHAGDFHGERTMPRNADPKLLKRIDDTALRTKLVTVGLAEGLQSPKGPQKIASILRIYPAFDAPPRPSANGRSGVRRGRPLRRGRSTASKRPTIAQLERLVLRYREIERAVGDELGIELDERIARLKRSLAELDGDALEAAYRDLGDALAQKRALTARIAEETFARLEADPNAAGREFLSLIER